ncbi:MAG: threonylcarbamoyl-AMP synthase [Burkholderiaceae bacterium]|nr:threonylcarbamoyl-AMP synthase [Burkholderiaceae bacterium]
MNAAIRQAAFELESGQLVVFPTETVYGLGADAENPVAVSMIYAVKGRPSDHPLIVHVHQTSDLSLWAHPVPVEAERLMAAFWPGPLTLVLNCAARVSRTVTGGQDTIGLRCPAHPVASRLLKAFKRGQGGIAGPSANRFGRVSPTRIQDVRSEWAHETRIASMLDGGQSEIGIESTIVDLSRVGTHGAVLLRPGKIGAADLAAILGDGLLEPSADAPRASGMLPSHYAPATPLVMVPTEALLRTVSSLTDRKCRVACMSWSLFLPPEKLWAKWDMPAAAAGYAHDLYAALHTLDRSAADIILVEALPEGDAWIAVGNRLQKAAYSYRHALGNLLGTSAAP